VKEFSEQCQRLHLKAQWMVALWEEVAEGRNTGVLKGVMAYQRSKTAVRRKGFLGTLVYAGVAAIVAEGMHALGVTQPIMIRFLIWLAVGVYGVLYCQWTGQDYGALVLPLWIGFAAACSTMTILEYLVSAMGLLVWVRSGRCYRNRRFLRAVGLDLLFCYGGLAGMVWMAQSLRMALLWVIFAFFFLQGLFFYWSWVSDHLEWEPINSQLIFRDNP
jgi:hypothetical protein